MNHYTWTYVAGEGRNIKVGLFHGSRTGHLLIYIGKKIVTIDFKVFESKDYAFFIDNELCRIKLERRGQEMYYFFEIDKQADTPMNRARWASERKILKQLLVGLALFALLITGFTIWLQSNRMTPDRRTELLVRNGVETTGRVKIEQRAGLPEITYHFVAQNQGYSSKSNIGSETLVLLVNGMPLESGDEFVVQYAPSDPDRNRIYFSRPTPRQIEIYQQRAADKYLQLHPDEAPNVVNCIIRTAFELEGIEGIADIYFQDTPPESNPDHNRQSFLKLTKSIPFQKRVERDCWQ